MKPRCTSHAFRSVLVALFALIPGLMFAHSPALAVSPDIVISQVYGGGGTLFTHDFIELHNRGTAGVNVATWSVQYRDPTGSTWHGTVLPSVTIPPGGYLLVRAEAGAGGGADMPPHDVSGSIPINAAGGMVVVRNKPNLLSGVPPVDASGIVDLLGYGAVSYFEGAPEAALTASTAAFRGNLGCVDTDHNASDFAAGAPSPRNSSSPVFQCQFTLTYLAGPNGTISGTTPQVVPNGGTGSAVTAVPNAGYHFVKWSDDVMTAARTDGPVTANLTVTAEFALNEYVLTYNAGPNGTISGTTPQNVPHGGTGTEVTAVPDPGYHFVKWSDDVVTASRTDGPVTANLTVTAEFALNEYVLTYNAGPNGSISGTTPQNVPHGGTGTEVTAVPDPGYHFVKWSDDVATAARTDGPVTANLTVTAEFALNEYVLTYNAGPNGSISGTTPQNVPHGGTGTEVTAVPNLGYHFVKWSDDVATAARTDGPVTANLTVTAEFALNEYTLTYLAGPNGSITGTTPQTVPHGGSGSAVTAVPNVGYHFVKWSDDVLTATRTDGPVTADVTVTAQFAEKLVVVSQIFGGGGQPGAPHTHDYVELFNRGDHPVDITDWTVQYAAATSTVWTAMSLSGVIQPHSYFLVQQATSGGVGSPLPAPDETGSIDLNGFSGKVALVSSLSTLTGSCPSVPAIEDLVGYGSATCSETSPAPELTNQLAALRDFDGCIDTGNNAQDFSAGTPTPRNSASPANDCLFTLTVLAAPSDKGSVTKSPDQAGYTPSSQVQITAVPIPGYHFDHWSGGASGSCNPLTVEMISDLTITAHFVSNDEAGQMVISQYFGGGGVLPQGLKNDYVELFNRGNGPVDVTGWTIQFAAATSSVWNATPLIGVVEPGHYFLVQLFTSGQGDVDLPTPDAIGALDLDPTQGKLALVSNDTDLTGICPGGIAIKDLVGYGAANCSETAPAASSSNTEASFRGDNGCRESNNNQGDFANGAPDPRNSAHDPYYCKIWLDVGTAPTQLSLGLPMPNPSRGQFNFSVALPVEGMVRVTVSDVQGRRVASLVNGNMPAGRHNLSWNGAGDAGPVRPGLYYLALENKGQRLVRRFVIIR